MDSCSEPIVTVGVPFARPQNDEFVRNLSPRAYFLWIRQAKKETLGKVNDWDLYPDYEHWAEAVKTVMTRWLITDIRLIKPRDRADFFRAVRSEQLRIKINKHANFPSTRARL